MGDQSNNILVLGPPCRIVVLGHNQMQDSPRCHPDADLLERYAMGKLTGTKLERLEEHLFIYRAC